MAGAGGRRRVPTGREAGTRTIAWWAGRVGCGQQRWAACLTPKLLILRLTTRGLARNRRLGTGCRNSSAVVAVMARASRRGGKARLAHDLAANHSKRADEGDAVGVDLAVQGGLVHELPDGVVDQEHAHTSCSTPRGSWNAAPGWGRAGGSSARPGRSPTPTAGRTARPTRPRVPHRGPGSWSPAGKVPAAGDAQDRPGHTPPPAP